MISRRQMLLLTTLAIAGCDGKTTPPKSTKARVIVLSPAIAVTMKDLGLESIIVGRHGYDLVLDQQLPVCGDQAGLDYEAISRLNPTHVLTQYDSGDVPPRLSKLATANGFNIINYRLLTLDAVRENARELARKFNVDGGRIDADFGRAWAKRGAGFQSVGKVLLLAAINPPGVLGPGSFHYQIAEMIGATPAPAMGAPYITMDSEDIFRLSPDAIVIVLPRGRGSVAPPPLSQAELVSLLGAIGTLDLPAIKKGRVALIDDPLAHTPSTAMIRLADSLAAILSGWSASAGK